MQLDEWLLKTALETAESLRGSKEEEASLLRHLIPTDTEVIKIRDNALAAEEWVEYPKDVLVLEFLFLFVFSIDFAIVNALQAHPRKQEFREMNVALWERLLPEDFGGALRGRMESYSSAIRAHDADSYAETFGREFSEQLGGPDIAVMTLAAGFSSEVYTGRIKALRSAFS